MYINIHIHVFRPSQESSVWLELTSREQLMSPECSKHQVLSFAKILVMNEQKNFFSHIHIYIQFSAGNDFVIFLEHATF